MSQTGDRLSVFQHSRFVLGIRFGFRASDFGLLAMPRTFALIPAAGHSTRMGQPKLLLPLAGQPLILHTIAAWQQSRVDRIVVVVRPGDEALAEVVRTADVDSGCARPLRRPT